MRAARNDLNGSRLLPIMGGALAVSSYSRSSNMEAFHACRGDDWDSSSNQKTGKQRPCPLHRALLRLRANLYLLRRRVFGEDNPVELRQCIRLNLDCADLCSATGAMGSRRTGRDDMTMRLVLQLAPKPAAFARKNASVTQVDMSIAEFAPKFAGLASAGAKTLRQQCIRRRKKLR